MPLLNCHHLLILYVLSLQARSRHISFLTFVYERISREQSSVPLYFTLTSKGCVSQHHTWAIPCHTQARAEPLVYPAAFSSSSLISALCGSSGGAVWEQTEAAYKRLPVVAKHLVCSSVWGPTELWYMCRKAQVRVREFKCLFANCSQAASVRSWKENLRGELK